MRRGVLPCLGLLLLVPWLSQAAPSQTYYVNGTSTNTEDCEQAKAKEPRDQRPMRTINAGIRCLKAGDTLIVQAGTYDELIGTLPSGTAGNPTILKSEVQYGAVIQPSASRQSQLFNGVGIIFFQQKDYITIDGLVVDAVNLTHVELISNGSADEAGAGSGHISIINNELKNGHDGGYPNSFGITVEAASHDWYIARNKVHHIGADAVIPTSQNSRQSYGMYYTGQNSILEDNEISHCGGFGIHQHNAVAASGGSSGNIIRKNRIHHNGVQVVQGGMLYAAGGTNNVLYNNLVYNNGAEGLIIGGYGVASTNNHVYNNTWYGNGGTCIRVGSGDKGPSGTVIRNNICHQNGSDTISQFNDTNTIRDPNLLDTPPLFRSTMAAAADFHLQPGHPLRGAGIDGCRTPQGCFIPTLFATDLDGCPITVTDGRVDAGAFQGGGCAADGATPLGFTPPLPPAMAGQAMAPVVVQLQDAAGTLVPTASARITLALAANPGGSTLTGTRDQDTLGGQATFRDLSLQQPAAGYVLQATAALLPPVSSAPFAVLTGPTDLTTGLVACSKLDTGTGPTAFDETAQHNTGTLMESPSVGARDVWEWGPVCRGDAVHHDSRRGRAQHPPGAHLERLGEYHSAGRECAVRQQGLRQSHRLGHRPAKRWQSGPASRFCDDAPL